MSDINEAVRAAIDEACTASADLLKEVRRLREENAQLRAAHLALTEQHTVAVRERASDREVARRAADRLDEVSQPELAAGIRQCIGTPLLSEIARVAAVADLERQIAELRAALLEACDLVARYVDDASEYTGLLHGEPARIGELLRELRERWRRLSTRTSAGSTPAPSGGGWWCI